MKIYTKTGDDGSTSMLSGEKVSKNDERIHFVGTLDELNSHLGLIKVQLSEEDTRQFLHAIQTTLMKLMAHGSDNTNEKYFLSGNETQELEREIDRLSEHLPRRFQLVLPGNTAIEAQIHIARTVARRAERHFAAANAAQPMSRHAGAYLNRLADYLYVLSLCDPVQLHQ